MKVLKFKKLKLIKWQKHIKWLQLKLLEWKLKVKKLVQNINKKKKSIYNYIFYCNIAKKKTVLQQRDSNYKKYLDV